MIEAPANFVGIKEGVYWILGYEPSDSNPSVKYEIRTSMRNGKTYCNCQACNMSYHKAGSDGTAKCKHLTRFAKRNPGVTLVLMDMEGILSIRRNLVVPDGVLTEGKSVNRKVKVKRRLI